MKAFVSPVLVRLALRLALRQKTYSLLMLALISIPVTAVTAAYVLSTSLDHSSSLRTLGQNRVANADAYVYFRENKQIEQGNFGEYQLVTNPTSPNGLPAIPPPQDIRKLIPDAALVTPVNQSWVVARAPRSTISFELIAMDPRNELNAGSFRLLKGRFPSSGNEVVLNKVATKNSGLALGSQLSLDQNAHLYTVVGFVEDPSNLNDPPFGITTELPADLQNVDPTSYRLRINGHIDDSAVKTLNSMGYVVYSHQLFDSDREAPFIGNAVIYDDDVSSSAAVVLVTTGLGFLTVWLLAGSGMLISFKRNRAVLGQLVSAGAEPRHLRALVLWSGFLLGAFGSFAGIAAGIGLAALTRNAAEIYAGFRFTELNVGIIPCCVLLVLGVTSAVIASIFPAISSSKVSLTEELHLRSPLKPVIKPRRFAYAGLVIFAVGGLTTAYTARAHMTGYLLLTSVILGIGALAMVPTFIAFVSKRADHFPLSVRMSLREIIRNNARSSATIAAIAAAVAGTVATATIVNAVDLTDRAKYQPSVPSGQVYFSLDNTNRSFDEIQKDVALRANQLRQLLPATDVAVRNAVFDKGCDVRLIRGCSNPMNVEIPRESTCYFDSTSYEDVDRISRTPACARVTGYTALEIADASLLEAVYATPPPPEALAALASGKAVVSDKVFVNTANQITISSTSPNGQSGSRLTLDAYVLPNKYQGTAAAYISRSTAEHLQLVGEIASQLVVSTNRMPTPREEAQVRALAESQSTNFVYVEHGYKHKSHKELQIALFASSMLALIATVIVTALNIVETKRDQSTLGAIGASPAYRRIAASVYALIVSVSGVALGTITALLVAAGWVWSEQFERVGSIYVHHDVPWPHAIPWNVMLGLLLAVPLLSAACAFAFTRSRKEYPISARFGDAATASAIR